jgi:hypothetical protein
MIVEVQHDDRSEALGRKQELTDWESLIHNISGKSSTELETWFIDHFSTIPEKAREGLFILVRSVWANSKANEKIWDFIRFFKK